MAADTLGAAIGRARAEQERVSAQTAAAQLEARTSAVLASALEGIVTMDAEGRIVDLNAAAERMFGRRLPDVEGRQLADILIPPDYRDRHRSALARYLETGEATILGQNLEIEALRANGERFPIELTVTRVEMAGAPMFTGFIRDLTERKQAERQLQETEERYRTLIENLPAATYVDDVDERSTTLFVTPQIEYDLGIHAAGVDGRTTTCGSTRSIRTIARRSCPPSSATTVTENPSRSSTASGPRTAAGRG